MRLFVAIDLPDDARDAVMAVETKVISRLKRSQDLRVVRPEQLHLTLAFIGQVDADRGSAIEHALTPEIPLPPFEMSLEGLGVFPRSGPPRVLWIGVARGAAQATELQRMVAERLEPLGVELDRRPFSPHLTLARWRTSRASDARSIRSEQIGLVTRFSVDGVTLYHSLLSPRGSSYRALARARLVTPSPPRAM